MWTMWPAAHIMALTRCTAPVGPNVNRLGYIQSALWLEDAARVFCTTGCPARVPPQAPSSVSSERHGLPKCTHLTFNTACALCSATTPCSTAHCCTSPAASITQSRTGFVVSAHRTTAQHDIRAAECTQMICGFLAASSVLKPSHQVSST